MKSERQKTLSAFQELRRLQESNEEGYCNCICSGKVYHYSEVDGGHFITRECQATELEPDNVWPQNRRSNRLKSGEYLTYRDSLVAKIGEKRVTRLENMKKAYSGNSDAYELLSDEDKIKVVIRKTDFEYKELRKGFNAEIRRLKKEKPCDR
jgi:hypothetical protein